MRSSILSASIFLISLLLAPSLHAKCCCKSTIRYFARTVDQDIGAILQAERDALVYVKEQIKEIVKEQAARASDAEERGREFVERIGETLLAGNVPQSMWSGYSHLDRIEQYFAHLLNFEVKHRYKPQATLETMLEAERAMAEVERAVAEVNGAYAIRKIVTDALDKPDTKARGAR